MIRLKVYDVGPPYPIHATPVLWLSDEQEERVLILMIGLAEAIAIKSQITEEDPPPPRPMTHDLLNSVFEHFNAEIQYILITELREEAYYIAEIHAELDGRSIRIDSRPTDAIALALRANAPIYAMEAVMDEAGKNMPPSSKAGEGEDEVIAAIEELQKEGVEKIVIEDMMETSEPEVQMDSNTPLETARKKLQAAIDAERYEDAARLRDEIKQMEQKA